MAACDWLLLQSAWRAVTEAASPSEDEGLCRAKSRQRRRAVLAPLERAPRLRSGMRSIGFPLGDPPPLPTPQPSLRAFGDIDQDLRHRRGGPKHQPQAVLDAEQVIVALLRKEIGRASCREEGVRTCRSWWAPCP